MTTLATLLPTFLMLGLGIFAQKTHLLTTEQASGIDKLAFDLLFPVMIFDALFTSGIPEGALLLTLAVLAVRLFSMAAASLLGKATHSREGFLLPYLFPSTDGGSVCYPLYATIVGAGFIQNIVLLDLSSMVAAFLIIPVMVSVRCSGSTKPGVLLKNIFGNRMVQAMLLGLAGNLLGVYGWLAQQPLWDVYSGIVSMLTEPLVALILFGIGYRFRLEKDGLVTLCAALAGRTAVMLLGGVVLLHLFPAIAADEEMRIAVLLYFGCSPTLSLSTMLSPIYRDEQDAGFVSAFLSLSMVVTLAWYTVVVLFLA